MSTHPDTIGRITVKGTDYDIDWPHLMDSTTGPEDYTEREDYGVIYSPDGKMLADFINQDWTPSGRYDGFSSREEVIEHARRYIEEGGLK